MNNIEESIVKISGETQYYSGSGDTFTNTGNEVDIVYNPDDFKGDNENKDLGNTKIGDGFRYRNRGYLYIKGKTQYEIFEKGAYKTIPYEISDIPDVAFLAAIYVWKNVKDNNNKSSNQYAHINGNSPTFERTIEISCPTKKEKDNFYLKFEKVLTAFSYKTKPLISYDRP